MKQRSRKEHRGITELRRYCGTRPIRRQALAAFFSGAQLYVQSCPISYFSFHHSRRLCEGPHLDVGHFHLDATALVFGLNQIPIQVFRRKGPVYDRSSCRDWRPAGIHHFALVVHLSSAESVGQPILMRGRGFRLRFCASAEQTFVPTAFGRRSRYSLSAFEMEVVK